MQLSAIRQHRPLIAGGLVSVVVIVGGLLYSHWRPPVPVSTRDGIVHCRTGGHSFRFSLPAGARDVTIGQVRGGRDTIEGSIFVRNAYDVVQFGEILRKHYFKWEIGTPLVTSIDQPGGWIREASGGQIDFYYFGDSLF